jgi:peptidoglycan/xylan/chitin deacetylase (PgdA/CDA1 family)
MIGLKKQIKTALASMALASGFLPRYVAGRLSGRAAVLMYHRVLPDQIKADSYSADGIIVSPETFREQMEVLRRRFKPLSLAEYIGHLEEGWFPDNSCLVTFDDGWFDNHEYALPVLEATQVPAVVFVATDFIGTSGCFWQESLSRLLADAARLGDDAAPTFSGLSRTDVHGLAPERRKLAIRQCIDGLKHRSLLEVTELTSCVENLLLAHGAPNTTRHPDRFLSWEQVIGLAGSGLVSIGSHCRSHVPLTRLDLSAASRELEESRQIIATRTGTSPIAIAYPNGDCNGQIGEAAGRAGYKAAFTTERGYASGTANHFLQKRINIHEHSTDSEGSFLARIALLT